MIWDQPVWAFAGYCLPLTSALLRSAILLNLLILQLLMMLMLLLLILQLLLMPLLHNLLPSTTHIYLTMASFPKKFPAKGSFTLPPNNTSGKRTSYTGGLIDIEQRSKLFKLLDSLATSSPSL